MPLSPQQDVLVRLSYAGHIMIKQEHIAWFIGALFVFAILYVGVTVLVSASKENLTMLHNESVATYSSPDIDYWKTGIAGIIICVVAITLVGLLSTEGGGDDKI